jgi:hypothetical protein
MKKLLMLLAILGVLGFGLSTQANAGVRIGIGVAPGYYGPGPYYGGYYGPGPYPYYGYYGPYGYYGYYGHPYYYGGYYGGGYYGHGGRSYGHGGYRH